MSTSEAPARPTVLVVDDEEDIRRLLKLRLQSEGYAVETAASGTEALGRLENHRARVVITDLRMDGMDGLALFDAIRRRWPGLPVIVLTAHGTIPDAVDATQRGVHAYLTKPFDPKTLLATVAAASKRGTFATSPSESDRSADWRAGILTRSPTLERVLEKARRIADTTANVLVQGESGTGKELLARAIHAASPRSDGPFVAVNCAAVPEHLLESELFGHRRGAFTGAVADKTGLFEAASGGTLFLDEVGDMPAPFQAKLLRALQEKEVRPVGATRSIPIDVRVISATHRDLDEEVDADRFRQDLQYRLQVVALTLPPLAERPEDVPLLAERFLIEHARANRRSCRAFAPDALERLASAPWPGNVRQLQNVVAQCVALSTGPLITDDLVRDALHEREAIWPTLDVVRDEAERSYLVRVLGVTGGNVTQAARLAGRNRTEFYKLLGRHGLEPRAFREPVSG